MTKHLCLILLVTVSAFGQPAPGEPKPRTIPPAPQLPDTSKLTKFDLNFPGGNPAQLVAAIEKATSRPLNVVIPEEYAAERIPPLRMTQVTVADLFRAMEQASIKTEPYRTGSYRGGGGQSSYSYQQLRTSITFQTSSGHVTDDSIWYFRGREKVPDLSGWDAEPVPQKTSRFYALTPYLEQGLKVEDITTAIQTGWKMLGEKEIPTISFHRETKLLIAVGEPGKLETIDAVLNALRPNSEGQANRSGRRAGAGVNALPQVGNPKPASLNPNATAEAAVAPNSEP